HPDRPPLHHHRGRPAGPRRAGARALPRAVLLGVALAPPRDRADDHVHGRAREAGMSDPLFEFRKVADGVHVAVARPAYKVNSNTAIIETDDGVLVVDSHSKPSAARAIVQQLPELTPRPVRYVVNTHF